MSRFTFDIFIERYRCTLPINIVCRHAHKPVITDPNMSFVTQIEADSYEDCIEKLKEYLHSYGREYEQVD